MRKRSRSSALRATMPGGRESWFALVDLFDPSKIQTCEPLAAGDPRFHILGQVEKLVIVEVPADANIESVERIAKYMGSLGHPAIIVQEGIRYLKLRALTHSESVAMDKRVAATRVEKPNVNDDSDV